MTKFAALFPGQGSQAVGMGLEFYKSEAAARELFDAVDDTLGYKLSKLCFEGPVEELTLTKNAQPAILTASYVAFKLSGLTPSAAAGHSLGEYTALVAAGSLKFTDAAMLVHKRGTYMQEAVPAGAGKMVAVLGPTVDEIKDVISTVAGGVKEIANINCPGQTVVAGDAAGVDGFAAEMAKRGAKIVPLNVSAPFHCALMQPAAEKLAGDLDRVAIADPQFPVYANVTAKPATTAAEVRELLKKQVCATVRWTDSIVNLLEAHSLTCTVEFGAGGVLSNLMKRINKQVTRLEVSDPATLAKTKAAVSA